jgi:pimeloyl-ACP methyl ester carboxylesterase
MNRRRSGRWRWLRWTLASVGVGLVSLVGLLHAAGLIFAGHNRRMTTASSHEVAGPNGRTLHYFRRLTDQAEWNVVFIHGTPATGAIFGEQFERPFPQANLYALDRPGFGGSAGMGLPPSLEAQADAVGSLLAQAGKERVILVGHSYGAPVALTAALRFTNAIAGVILIGGCLDPAEERPYLAQHVADWPVLSWLEPAWLRQCNRELLTLKQDLVALRPSLSALGVPVLMVHGLRDQQVPPTNVDFLRQCLESAGKSTLLETLILPEADHFIPWEHPEAVETALRRMTERIRATPSTRPNLTGRR